MKNDTRTFSENIWRESSLVPDSSMPSRGFGVMSQVQPESASEARFLASPTPRYPFPMPPSPIAGINRESMPEAANPIAAALGASLKKSSDRLESDFNDRNSKGQFSPLSASTIEDLKVNNPIAYDRIQALAPDQQSRSLAAGPAQDVMFLIASAPKVSGGNGAAASSGQWEELFSARRSNAGPTTVTGQRLHDNEWYHFASHIATPPKSMKDRPRGGSAPAASTSFAPERLLKSKNPSTLPDLGSSAVRKAVQGITEGPWRPFLQGKTLKGSDHAVQGVNSSPKGLDAFKAAFDSVNGVLKKIQDVAKGIMKAADYLGILGELGQFGDVLKWIGALNLPKSPADLINSLILGKGIFPGDTPPAPAGMCTGSGEGGLVVTQNGAAAEHLGKGLKTDVAILQKQGSGENGAKAKDSKAEVKHKPPAKDKNKPESDKSGGKKSEDNKTEKPKDAKTEGQGSKTPDDTKTESPPNDSDSPPKETPTPEAGPTPTPDIGGKKPDTQPNDSNSSPKEFPKPEPGPTPNPEVAVAAPPEDKKSEKDNSSSPYGDSLEDGSSSSGNKRSTLAHLREAGVGVLEIGPYDAVGAAATGEAADAFAFQNNYSKGGEKNAARHALWQALLTQNHGSDSAAAIGDAHEYGSKDPVDTQIDQHNNRVGREIGESTRGGDPREAIREAIRDGRLITSKDDPRLKK